MPESIDRWWARRQFSTERAVPYPIGAYRDAWSPFSVLVEQFRPERNGGLLLSQIPPAAEVYLVWVCAIGHEFVATPAEQRGRPGRSRSSRSWCPVCAVPPAVAPGRKWPRPAPLDPGGEGASGGAPRAPAMHPAARIRPRHVPAAARAIPTVDAHEVPIGRAFRSGRAPRATSAAEGLVRERIAERLTVDLTSNAVRIRAPFFDRLEVWPDIVIPELAVAVELDTVGRAADEHIGRREAVDRRKDRLLRDVGWEVVRLRVKPLRPLGPWDMVVPGVSARAIDALVERIAEVRGDLIVAAYRLDAR